MNKQQYRNHRIGNIAFNTLAFASVVYAGKGLSEGNNIDALLGFTGAVFFEGCNFLRYLRKRDLQKAYELSPQIHELDHELGKEFDRLLGVKYQG